MSDFYVETELGTGCVKNTPAHDFNDTDTKLTRFGFRDYSSDIGRWTTKDLIGFGGGINHYSYVGGNPLSYVDIFGLAVCVVLFPDYPIAYYGSNTSTWLGGHGGVLEIDDNGSTSYFEFGRYSPDDNSVIGTTLDSSEGNYREIIVSDINIEEFGLATYDSLVQLGEDLSKKAGKNTKVALDCNFDADANKLKDYVNELANNPDRDSYDWGPIFPNHCRSFANDALEESQ